MTRPLALVLLLAAAPAATEPIRVQVTRVGLSPKQPPVESVGALVFRGGLMLSSPDKRFGGLSGLLVSGDGSRLRAVSDEGGWLEARLVYDARGFLVGLEGAEVGPILDPERRPLQDKTWQDAECLTALPDGSLVVGFERHHRLWRFRGARPFEGPAEPFTAPPTLGRLPENGGLEAIAGLPDGRFLALAEQPPDEMGYLQGFLLQAGRWSPVSYHVRDTPVPSDAAVLPSGDVLVLERSYSPAQGIVARLRRIPLADLTPGALLDPPVLAEFRPPLAIDNFEGLAARSGPGGETLVYIVSDDNFSNVQRTLLFLFALKEAPER